MFSCCVYTIDAAQCIDTQLPVNSSPGQMKAVVPNTTIVRGQLKYSMGWSMEK